jgi:hypothetical protein
MGFLLRLFPVRARVGRGRHVINIRLRSAVNMDDLDEWFVCPGLLVYVSTIIVCTAVHYEFRAVPINGRFSIVINLRRKLLQFLSKTQSMALPVEVATFDTDMQYYTKYVDLT